MADKITKQSTSENTLASNLKLYSFGNVRVLVANLASVSNVTGATIPSGDRPSMRVCAGCFALQSNYANRGAGYIEVATNGSLSISGISSIANTDLLAANACWIV